MQDNGYTRKGKQKKLRWAHAPLKMWHNKDNSDRETGRQKRRRRRQGTAGTAGTAIGKMRYSRDGDLRRCETACNSVPYQRSETCAIEGKTTG